MLELLVIRTGLYEEAEQFEAALALFDAKHMRRHTIDIGKMNEKDWDALLDDVIEAKTVITL